jgi:two-component system sporulation sensor kinase A
MILEEKVAINRYKNEVTQKYGALMVTSPTFFIIVNSLGNVLYINPSTEKLLDVSNEEIFQKPIFAVTSFKDREKLKKVISDILEGRKSVCRWDDQKISKTGEIFSVQNEASFVQILNQSTVLIHSMMSQPKKPFFTFRRKVEPIQYQQYGTAIDQAKVQPNDEVFRILESSPFDIITKKDINGLYTYISSSVTKIIGYEPEELVGKPCFDIIHPDDQALVKGYHSLDRDREDFSLITYRKQQKDGTYKWFESTVSLMYDGLTENPTGFIEICRDISERKRYEQVLSESREQYRRLVNNSLDTIGIIDDGKWVFINDSGIKMFAAENDEQILGKSIYDFLHPKYHELCLERVRIVLKEKKIAPRMEQEWCTLDKKSIYTEVVGIPTTYENKRAIMIIIRDITDRKHTEERMINSEKLSMAGELAAGIAHEIRNPLTSLKGFLQFIQSGKGDKEHYYEIMGSELNRIEFILNELLMLAKPQQTLFKKTNLVPLVEHVVTLLETHALMNNIEIITFYEMDQIDIECDENQIKQVFINLLKNAIEAMPQGGQVRVHVHLTNHQIMIELVDQGNGIPEEELAKIGQPFYTTKEKGTGLGLMVSFQIIENHNGSISVSSKVNEGTSFKVFLPLSRDT